MTSSISSEEKAYEPVRTLSLGNWRAELLPSAPYQAAYRSTHSSIGYAFTAQRGIHSIGTDKRIEFCARPNSIAFVPKHCDVYSESEQGGEYLKLWQVNEKETSSSFPNSFRNIIEPAAVKAAHEIRRLLISNNPIDDLMCEQYFFTLDASCKQLNSDTNENVAIDNKRLNEQWHSQVLELIETKITSRLTVSELACTFNLSARQFSRKFRHLIGVTPHSYILDRRLTLARRLLLNSAWDHTAIALECGFSSHSHMTAQLRTRHGATPSQLRALLNKF